MGCVSVDGKQQTNWERSFRMYRYTCAFLSLALAFAGVAAAQTTPTTTDNGPKVLSAAGIEIGGLIDGYYSANFNHPASKSNTWRNFDVKANSFALNFAKLMMKRLTHTGSTLRIRDIAFKAEIARQLEASVWPLIENGIVKPVMDSTFPLEQASAAHARIEEGSHVGKIVLEIF